MTMWESARPRRGWSRRTKEAEKGLVEVAASGSGICPLTRSSISARKRVSREKRPSGKEACMFPVRPEIQKAGPSTRVTVPPEPPRGGLAEDGQGLTTAGGET